jgi:hypothetical protein
MSEAEFLVKMRDGAMMIVDACQKRLEKLAIASTKETIWNPQNIAWIKAEGSAGPYEKSEDVNSLDFKELLKDLSAHNGKLTRDGLFYWKFERGDAVGRKPSKK